MDQPLDVESMNAEEVNTALEDAQFKLDHARRQIAHLDSQIAYLRKLFRRAEKNKGYAVRYNLRMQLSIVSGVKVMYHHYAAMKEERIARLRVRVDSVNSQQIHRMVEALEERTDS